MNNVTPRKSVRLPLQWAHGLMSGPVAIVLALMAILAGTFVTVMVTRPAVEGFSPDSFFSRTSSEISQRDLEYYVQVLSSAHMEGRESGRESGQRATEFLLRQYRSSELKGYFNGSFYQEFSFPGAIQAGPDARLFFVPERLPLDLNPAVARWKAAGQQLFANVPAVPVGFARPTEAQGQMIFGGFCVSAPGKNFDELARINVAGKIVICLRYGPGGRDGGFLEEISFRAKYKALQARGAAGVVFLSRPGTPEVNAADFRGSSQGGPPSVFVSPDALYSRFPWLKEHDAELVSGEPRYSERLGNPMGQVLVGMDYSREELLGRNVAASIKGTFEEGKVLDRIWIVVGGHYDHLGHGHFGSLEGPGEIHNGADDNASGTAAVLEVAFSLQKMYEANPAILPEPFDVVFMHFDAEERGLFGAEHLVNSEEFLPGNTAAMLNLDMVGMLRSGKGLQLQGAQSADSSWKEMIDRAFLSASFPEEYKLRWMPGGNGPSDHSPFYRKEIPVAFFFTGEHAYYHKPADDFHRLNYRGLLHVSQMARALVLEVARNGRPGFQEAPEARRSDLEFNVRLGVIPGGYGDSEGGLLVAGVKEDAPVAKTGIQKGDRIVSIGGTPIENIRDLTEFLYDAQLNRSYEIQFKRGNEIIRSRTELMAGGSH